MLAIFVLLITLEVTGLVLARSIYLSIVILVLKISGIKFMSILLKNIMLNSLFVCLNVFISDTIYFFE